MPKSSKRHDPTHSLAPLIATLRAAGCVYAEEEARLLMAANRPGELTAMVEQRLAGMPLEYILGWAEFCGLRIRVDAGVFIPRRRTEFLARQAIHLARPGCTVLDLCCGCGALGAALAHAVPAIRLLASDIDPAAVRCARRNLAAWGGHVHQGDLFAPLPEALRGRLDIVVANAPYVPSGDIQRLPREARLHEPLLSLDGGKDGHQVQLRVAEQSSGWLAPGGRLLVETSERQAARTADIFRSRGLVPHVVRSEEWDATVVIGTKPR